MTEFKYYLDELEKSYIRDDLHFKLETRENHRRNFSVVILPCQVSGSQKEKKDLYKDILHDILDYAWGVNKKVVIYFENLQIREYVLGDLFAYLSKHYRYEIEKENKKFHFSILS